MSESVPQEAMQEAGQEVKEESVKEEAEEEITKDEESLFSQPLFVRLVYEIAAKTGIDKTGISNELIKVQDTVAVIHALQEAINKTSNSTRRLDLYNALVEVINCHEEIEGLTEEINLSILDTLVKLNIKVKDCNKLERLGLAMTKIVGNMKDKNEFEKHLPIKGIYNNLAFGALAVNGIFNFEGLKKDLVYDNYQAFQALILILKSKKFTALKEEDQKSFLEIQLQQMGCQLLKGNNFEKVLGTIFFKYLYQFELPKIVLPFDLFISMMKTSEISIKFGVLEFFNSIPVEAVNPEKELPIALKTFLLSFDGYETEFAKLLIKFCNLYKSVPTFNENILKLAAIDETLPGVILIALNLGLFDSIENMISSVFIIPSKLQRSLVLMNTVEYVSKNEMFTEALFEAFLNQAFLIYSSEMVINKKFDRALTLSTIPLFVKASQKFAEKFANFMLKRFCEIVDQEIIRLFADNIAELEIPTPVTVEEDEYLEFVCKLFGKIKSLQEIEKILSLYIVNDKEEPLNVYEFVKKIVKEDALPKLANKAEGLLKAFPRLAVLCVSYPEQSEAKLNELLKFILQDEIFTLDLGIEFFEASAIHYRKYILNVFNKEAFGKYITNNIFVSKKKRVRISESTRASLIVLPKLIKEKELTPEQQEEILRIICSIFPSNNIEDYVNELDGLGPLIELVKDVAPTEEQYNMLIPYFIKQYHILFNKLEENEELAKKLLKTYLESKYFVEFNEEVCKNVATIVLKLSPKADTFFYAISKFIRFFTKSKDILKYLVYSQTFAEATVKYNLEFNDIKYTEFFVHILKISNSSDIKIRNSAIKTLAALYKVEQVPEEVLETEYSEEQIDHILIQFYSDVSKNITRELLNSIYGALIKNDVYCSSAGLFVRATFENLPNLITKETEPFIIKFLHLYTDMPYLYKYHFENGLYALFKRSFHEFLPLIIFEECSFQEEMIKRILSDQAMRQTFIQEFFTYLISSEESLKNLILFKHLILILKTEKTNEFSDETFGLIISSIVIWISTLYHHYDDLGIIKINSNLNLISELLDVLFVKTLIGERYSLDVDVEPSIDYHKTLSKIAFLISKVNVEKISSVFSFITKMIESSNEPCKIGAALFLLNVATFYTYNNKITNEFLTKLYQTIPKAIQVCSDKSIRIIGYSYNKLIKDDKIFSVEGKTIICNSLINSLIYDSNDFTYECSLILARLITDVPDENLDGEKLLEASKKVFTKLQFEKYMLTIVDKYLNIKCDIADFISNSNLSIEGLLKLLPISEEDIINILKKICKSDEIIKIISTKVNTPTLAKYGLSTLNAVKSINNEVQMNLFVDFVQFIGKADNITSQKFYHSLLSVLLQISESYDNQLKDASTKLISTMINL